MTTSNHMFLIPVFGLLAFGCHPSSVRGDEPPPSAVASSDLEASPPTPVHVKTVTREGGQTSPPSTQTQSHPSIPKEYQSLRASLMARHPNDLPNSDALHRRPEAEAGLRWLAQHDDSLLVRARALTLLGLFPTSSNQQLLCAVMEDGANHPKLRAAAIEGLAGWDLDREQALRGRLAKMLYDANTRVALEAIAVLQRFPAAHAELKRVAEDTGAPRVVRDKAQEVVE